ncbi:MAG: 30S ribosomal protein S20 [Elusimicrobia bacterium]|nr:30S ribosomal protein S20 [Elusimicrobiota bacterium]
MAVKKKPTRHASALKAQRKSLRRYLRNRAMKKQIRSASKAVVEAKGAGASELLAKSAAALDKAARHGVIHWKTAARKKSRLAKRAAAQASAPAQAPAAA